MGEGRQQGPEGFPFRKRLGTWGTDGAKDSQEAQKLIQSCFKIMNNNVKAF